MPRNLRLALTALALAVLAPTARSADLTFDVDRLPDLTAADLPSLSADKSGTAYASLLEGKDVVPPRATRAKALFLSRPSRDGSELAFGLWAVALRNPIEANILLGRPGENGPAVATLYGPNAPGGGRVWGQLATGTLTADDLEGPFAGQSLYRLFAAIEAGEAYVQIATDDGEPGDNTGAGDFVDGEIRGEVVRLGRPFPMPMARLQVIHNAADPAAATVDVWLNGAKALDDFAFRAATPYLDVPAETEIAIGIAGADSEDPSDILVTIPVTLAKGGTYVAFANGVLDPTAFAANPDGRDTGFGLLVKPMARENAQDGGKVEFFVLHGATDAPTVDVLARGVGALVNDAAYRDITDYLAVPAAKYVLDVTPGSDNGTVVASFVADLSGLEGGAAAVFASGFLDPSANQGGEAFGIFAALPDGKVVAFPAKSAFEVRSESDFELPARGRDGVSTSASLGAAPLTFEVSQNLPNPVRGSTTVAFALPREANVLLTVHDVAGRRVGEVAPGTLSAGRHQIRFDASRLTSGVYWYRLQAGPEVQTRKMVVTR